MDGRSNEPSKLQLGFGAVPIVDGAEDDDAAARVTSTAEVDSWRRLLLLSLAYTVPLIGLQYMFQAFLATPLMGGVTLKGAFMFALATPMQYYVGQRYYRAAYLGYMHGVSIRLEQKRRSKANERMNQRKSEQESQATRETPRSSLSIHSCDWLLAGVSETHSLSAVSLLPYLW